MYSVHYAWTMTQCLKVVSEGHRLDVLSVFRVFRAQPTPGNTMLAPSYCTDSKDTVCLFVSLFVETSKCVSLPKISDRVFIMWARNKNLEVSMPSIKCHKSKISLCEVFSTPPPLFFNSSIVNYGKG